MPGELPRELLGGPRRQREAKTATSVAVVSHTGLMDKSTTHPHSVPSRDREGQRTQETPSERFEERYTAAVVIYADEEHIRGPEHAAALLLGYMHRYNDFPIELSDRVTDEKVVLRPRDLFALLEDPDTDPQLAEAVRHELMWWDEPPQYQVIPE